MPALTRWTRLALAGLCVGMNVMEAADIGAIFSVFIARIRFFQGPELKRAFRWSEKFPAASAAWPWLPCLPDFSRCKPSWHWSVPPSPALSAPDRTRKPKLHHWDWATQWSLPKAETLGLVVPGLFGYKLDTPKDMMPMLQNAYKGGEYWGGVGRDPAIDRYSTAAGRANSRPVSCVSPAAAIISASSSRCWRRSPSRNPSGGKTRRSPKCKSGSSGSGPWWWPVRCCCRGAGRAGFLQAVLRPAVCLHHPESGKIRPQAYMGDRDLFAYGINMLASVI